ncbi:uncharacterized protein N7479_001775 [Penicillium vulpinum]|uniref:uncharacterized protein n=1 Tax=Penicillium vulpinum TaxID=29845 RepID=UPI0025475519|nr:uncharacterized protein N7479_001775 [Penicillium vulpinum]KAJ5971857.1 hypothetical protein N7479_001775 [Penicillium vulpinum]
MESNLELGESFLEGSLRKKTQETSRVKATTTLIILIVLLSLNIPIADLLYTPPPYTSCRPLLPPTVDHHAKRPNQWAFLLVTNRLLRRRTHRELPWLDDYDELFVSWGYHLLHCTYTWRKMHQALLRGRPVDNYIGKYNHTAHCEAMLLAQHIEHNSTNTIIQTKFVSC